MKSKNIYFIIFITIGFSIICKSQNKNVLDYYNDTNIFIIDTIYRRVNVEGNYFTVKILRDRFNEYFEEYKIDEKDRSRLTVLFLDENSNIRYVNSFNGIRGRVQWRTNIFFYKIGSPDLSNKGRLYFTIEEAGDGNGMNLYNNYIFIENNKLIYERICVSGAESYSFFNKNDNEILVFNFIFGDNETYQSDHKYNITSYRYTAEGYWVKKYIGKTKNKYFYPEADYNKEFSRIKGNEKHLSFKFNSTDYIEYNYLIN